MKFQIFKNNGYFVTETEPEFTGKIAKNGVVFARKGELVWLYGGAMRLMVSLLVFGLIFCLVVFFVVYALPAGPAGG